MVLSKWILPVLVATSLFFSGCSKKEVWVYTNLSKETISEFDVIARIALPKIDVKWLQGASDTIAETFDAELKEGKPRAGILITGDPLWYLELKKRNVLLQYNSPATTDIPTQYKDAENFYSAFRLSAMLIAYNYKTYTPMDVPEKWTDLTKPNWKQKISIGSPLESEISFIGVSKLAKRFGWEYFAELRNLSLVALGGNQAVISRIETSERPVGIVLLENVVKAQKLGVPVRPIYPLDGVIPIPGYIAITKTVKHPKAAKKLYDWLFSPAAQNVLTNNFIYSPNPKIVTPDNTRPWRELRTNLFEWNNEVLKELLDERDQIRARFSETVLH